ncbi:hypothetical protein EYF80_002986 [Liparis tanakae]|uniref:Uncharacterized protein n=1 Tax=Liparis tanakae TaxID=230148 RepID=A0A4Z2JAN4_9TELE|nr:hypothetical protein EYF80_002986 [Liparis tanakae]
MSASWVKVVRPAGGEDLLRRQKHSEVTPGATKVTSLPRLISAKTFLMPSPLPTCQMVASTCWLIKRALFSQQQVCRSRRPPKVTERSVTHPKAYTSAAVEKGRRSSLLPGLILRTISVHHLLFEELQVVLVVAVDLQEPDGDLAVPPPLMHSAPAALRPHRHKPSAACRLVGTRRVCCGRLSAHLPDELPEVQLLEGDVPLLQVDAGKPPPNMQNMTARAIPHYRQQVVSNSH